MAAKRLFEFVEGSSSKFWEVWADGATVYTRFGKIGSAGQTKMKSEGSPAAAEKAVEKLVAEKTGKGYVEQGGGAGKAAAPKKAVAKPAPVGDDDDEDDDAADDDEPPPSGPRRFELVEGSSSKFWEIELDGSSHTVRYGKIGTDGQVSTKSFANPAAAQKDYAKLVAQKTGKGYSEVDPNKSAAPELDAKELKRHLANIAKEEGAVLVLADWLQGQNHPWGELVVLQHGAATAPTDKKRAQLEAEAEKLLKAKGSAILGKLARDSRSRFTWKHGFVRVATLGTEPTGKGVLADVKAFLALPIAHVLEGLVINPAPTRFDTHQDWGDSHANLVDPWPDLEALAKLVPERITHVGFGAPTGPAAAYITMPSFTKLSAAFKRLAKLELTGHCPEKPGKLALPNLVELDVRFGEANQAGLEAIGASKLSKLERLSLWLGGSSHCILDDAYAPEELEYDDNDEPIGDGERYPATYSDSDLASLSVYDVRTRISPEQLTALLASPLAATVVHLGLQSTVWTTELLAALAKAPLLKRLKTLDLSGGNLSDETSNRIVAAAKAFAHLEVLNLERNQLGSAAAKKLAAALPNAKVGAQETRKTPEFFFRYVATME